MRKVRADLHLHTCLSPCADSRMQATAIVERAKKVGLDMIAICDHNSAENAAAVVKAGQRAGLAVIGGMEVTSSEEVHILGLFDTAADLMYMQDMVYENLPGENSEEAFGSQIVIDEWDNVVGKNPRLLIGATTLTVEQIVDSIHRWAGVAIASHVDRERFSLIGQLGFIPQGLDLDALEVSRSCSTVLEYDYPVVTSSDAHFLDDIGRRSTCFMIESASLGEIRKALRREMGRRIAGN
ncbi:MAG TPA: PHP domain-containing protein [Sedimentisphaerales bacterium]|nr:PHP domain-containing protein [Sedimentisphaerales bacterium]